MTSSVEPVTYKQMQAIWRQSFERVQAGIRRDYMLAVNAGVCGRCATRTVRQSEKRHNWLECSVCGHIYRKPSLEDATP